MASDGSRVKQDVSAAEQRQQKAKAERSDASFARNAIAAVQCGGEEEQTVADQGGLEALASDGPMIRVRSQATQTRMPERRLDWRGTSGDGQVDCAPARRVSEIGTAALPATMCHPFLPTVFLLVLPIAYFAYRIGALRSAALRWTIGALLIGVVALEFPFSGLGEPYVAYLKMLISAFMAAWTVVRGRGFDGQALDRRTLALVVGMAMASVCVSWDFFAFHGNHALIHYPEFTHYYLGSKYFPELGYGSLYTAMLEAEQESTGALSVEEARDLSTNHVVPASDLLNRAGEVKARFTPERWSQFAEGRRFLSPKSRPPLCDSRHRPRVQSVARLGTVRRCDRQSRACHKHRRARSSPISISCSKPWLSSRSLRRSVSSSHW